MMRNNRETAVQVYSFFATKEDVHNLCCCYKRELVNNRETAFKIMRT